MDPQTRTMPIRTPHEALGRNFPPTAPWGVPSANPAGFSRNRPKTRGTALRAPGGNAHESVGRTVRPTAPWGMPSSYAFFTRIGAPRLRIPRVLPRCRRKAPRNAPGGPKGSHERHPPPQAETGRRKHRKNCDFPEFTHRITRVLRGLPEFAHRIPRFLRGRRKPARKGHGKTRRFGTTGISIRVKIRGFPISGCQNRHFLTKKGRKARILPRQNPDFFPTPDVIRSDSRP